MNQCEPQWTVDVVDAIATFEANRSSVEELQRQFQEILAAHRDDESDPVFDLVDLAENELENVLFTSLLAEHRPRALECVARLRRDLAESRAAR
ncbi:hypothetical protein [Jatrophihabitans fulvus]